MGKSRLAKVIFTNIRKISDAWDKQFWQIYHDCAMYEKCFYFLLNSSFSIKMVFLRKLKPIYPSTSQDYSNCSAPTFLILFKKLLAPPPFKKEDRNCIIYERLQRTDNKVITIIYDRFFTCRTVKSKHLKKIKKSYKK